MGGGWLTPHPGRYKPQKENRYPFYMGLGGPQGRYGRVRKISPLPRFDPRTVQLVRVAIPTALIDAVPIGLAN